MANVMDVDVAGCILQMETHPPVTAKFYAGSATALNAETTYPWGKSGILATDSYQYSVPPMVGLLVKFKDNTTSYDAPCVEMHADGGNGNLICGFITHIGANQNPADGYFDVSVYFFQPGDILKLYSSDHGSATLPVFNQSVSYYTGERAWQVDNTNGCGRVIKTPPAKGDDFLLLWTRYGAV